MNRERLELLRDTLRDKDQMSKLVFNMSAWGEARKLSNLEQLSERTLDDLKHECGFAGCALGTAALIPEFRKAGLRLKRLHGGFHIELAHDPGCINFSAAAVFFGFKYDTATHLFSPGHYDVTQIRPQRVARRIQKLLDLGEAEFLYRFNERW